MFPYPVPVNSHSNAPSSSMSIQTCPGLWSLASTFTSKLTVVKVTLRGTSIVVALFVAPPCKVTSTVAKPPVNVLIVEGSPEANTRPIGTQDPSNNSIIKTGEARRMLAPGGSNENVAPSSAFS